MRHIGKEEEKQSPRMGIERRAEDKISTVGGGRPNFRRTGRRRRNWIKLENDRRWRMAGAGEWQALENGRRWRMAGAGE
jgi:hypothetical protein